MTPKKPEKIIKLGNHQELDFDVSVPLDGFLKTHTHLLGSTGTGKTFFLAHLAQQFIASGYGVILLDGVGQAYELVRDWLFSIKYPAKRFDLIDPSNDRMPGINYLELLGEGNSPETWAPVVLQGLKKMFREGDERKVWFEKYGLMALIPLIRSGMTLMELGRFVSAAKPELREAILSLEENEELSRMWDDFAQMKSDERERRIGSTETRGDILTLDAPPLQRLLGQQTTSIDWRTVMDKSGVVLANCRRSEHLTNTGSEVLGTVLMDQIVRTAYNRPPGKAKPCFVIADEFQRFVSPDFADALTTLRNYGVYFLLSHQYLAQLDSIEGLRDSVQTNCKNKFVFSISAGDADELADNLWAGDAFPYYRIKDEIYRTFYEPHETTRTIKTENWSTTDISSSATASSFGETHSLDTSPLIFGPVESPYMGTSSSQTTVEGSGSAYQEGGGTAEVPFHELIEREELSSRSFHDHVATRHWLAGSLVAQDRREVLAKIGANPPIPLTTTTYKPALLADSFRKFSLSKLTSKYRDPEELDQERKERIPKFLEAKNQLNADEFQTIETTPVSVPKNKRD